MRLYEVIWKEVFVDKLEHDGANGETYIAS